MPLPTEPTTAHAALPGGLMMESRLTLDSILRRASRVYAEKKVVSRGNDLAVSATTYAELRPRVARLMNVLRSLGVKPGDRVATFAWNHSRHLELYFAVPSMGAILHTLNIRLAPGQLRFIVDHAEDAVILYDRSLAPSLRPLLERADRREAFVCMDDGAPDAEPLPGSLDYEALMAAADDAERFIDADENAAAALCYTSGTTGDPKGVLYTHRSLYLHSVGICMADSLAISERETVLPVVPMFHANAWGIPYACALTGASLVLPGPHVVGKPLADLVERERVTLSAGVPSVYTVLHQYLRQHPHNISSLRTLVIGGSAAPAALIEAWRRDFGVPVVHAWGMTELSPVGTVCRLRASMQALEPAEQLPVLAKQGIPVPMVEADVLDETGAPAPWDGKATGELVVRGPWVARAYYKDEGGPSPLTGDGWFRTGDVARIDPHGYVELTDRKKDVIKSRGEWISSVEMENAVMGMPGVLEAAVIGRPHPLRGEVAAAFVVRRPGTEPITGADVRDHLAADFARWQLPRLKDIHFVEALPKTGTGKFDKKALRAGLQAS